MKVIIDVTEEDFRKVQDGRASVVMMRDAIRNGTPLTLNTLADALMEERIRGKLDSDTTFEKDIIRDVKCRLTVDIIDNRPCYCGAELREVWRESEVLDANSN